MSRKGVTPVIATVLLITISVAATASAYTFINTIQSDIQSHFEEDLTEEQRQQQSSFNIEYVYENDDYIFLSLRNTGTLELVMKDGDDYRLDLYTEQRPISTDEWSFVSEEDQVSLRSEQTTTINTSEAFPDEGDSVFLELYGPFQTSSTYVCHNSGSSSC